MLNLNIKTVQSKIRILTFQLFCIMKLTNLSLTLVESSMYGIESVVISDMLSPSPLTSLLAVLTSLLSADNVLAEPLEDFLLFVPWSEFLSVFSDSSSAM